MPGPQNIITGDDTGVELPQMQVDETSLLEEKKMAKYSRSSEFARIKQHCEDRIKFYQSHLPDGRDVREGVLPTPQDWVVANAVIAEFNALLNSYQIANEAVEEDAKQKSGK